VHHKAAAATAAVAVVVETAAAAAAAAATAWRQSWRSWEATPIYGRMQQSLGSKSESTNLSELVTELSTGAL
jgi:hypothetical protein